MIWVSPILVVNGIMVEVYASIRSSLTRSILGNVYSTYTNYNQIRQHQMTNTPQKKLSTSSLILWTTLFSPQTRTQMKVIMITTLSSPHSTYISYLPLQRSFTISLNSVHFTLEFCFLITRSQYHKGILGNLSHQRGTLALQWRARVVHGRVLDLTAALYFFVPKEKKGWFSTRT